MPIENIALLLAIYGAVLSTVLGLREIWKDRQNLKVSCTYGFVPMDPMKFVKDEAMKFVIIEVVNRGPRPIEIVAAGFMLSDRSIWFQVANKLGQIQMTHALNDKQRATYMYDWETIAKGVRDAFSKGVRFRTAFVKDSEGNFFTCRLPKGFEKDAIAS